MLLPSNKRVHLSVGPVNVTGRLTPAGKNLATAATEEAAVSGADAADLGSASGAVLLKLAARLGPGKAKGLKVDIELADSFGHYAVMQADVLRVSPAELDHLADLWLTDLLGVSAGTMALRCSPQKDGASAVVCAVPAEILVALREAVRAAGYLPGKLETAFSRGWNDFVSHAPSQSAMLIWRRADTAVIGSLQAGVWSSLSAERCSAQGWDALLESCAAFCSRMSIPESAGLPVYVDTDDVECTGAAPSGWIRMRQAVPGLQSARSVPSVPAPHTPSSDAVAATLTAMADAKPRAA